MRTEGHGFGLDSADIEWFSAQWAPGPAMRRDPRVSPLCAPDLTGLPAAIIATCERADFYDQAGACRYMIVTHLFQVLGFVSIEPPTALDARHLPTRPPKSSTRSRRSTPPTRSAANTPAPPASPAQAVTRPALLAV
jgi:hypothetical protein